MADILIAPALTYADEETAVLDLTVTADTLDVTLGYPLISQIYPIDDAYFARITGALVYSSVFEVDDLTTGKDYLFDIDPATPVFLPNAPAYIEGEYSCALTSPPPFEGTLTGVPYPCFAAGTMIATPTGPTAVETLEVGDMVLTHGGEPRRLVWVGRRHVDLRRHAAPELAQPVRISAGAWGANCPSTDLVVSPDHNLFVDGVLIPAKCLVNGRNVVVLDVDHVTYHHIELATHDVVLANNMPAETYLDTGNRTSFAGGDVTVAHPDFWSAPDLNYFLWQANGCAPLVLVGPELDAARRRLSQRADDAARVAVENRLRNRNEGGSGKVRRRLVRGRKRG